MVRPQATVPQPSEAPSASSAAQVGSNPNSTTSTGTGTCVPSRSTNFVTVNDDRESPACGGDNLFPQQGSAQTFNQIERAPLHLVRTVDREIDRSMHCERGERDSLGCRLRGRVFRCRNANKAKALAMASASASMAKVAVEPVPSPTTMPSCTSATAASAASRLSASRPPSMEGVVALMMRPPRWRFGGWQRWRPCSPS